MKMYPSALARGAAAMVTPRFRSATSASDTSPASSLPTVSSAAAMPSGAASRTRSSRPGPYSTGVPPKPRTRAKLAGLAGLLEHTDADGSGGSVQQDGLALPGRRGVQQVGCGRADEQEAGCLRER